MIDQIGHLLSDAVSTFFGLLVAFLIILGIVDVLILVLVRGNRNRD